MKLTATYSVKLNKNGISHAMKDTVDIYRKAVDFYIFVINGEWDAAFCMITTQKAAVNTAEALSVATKKRPVVKYDFGTGFYKFPSYLRRAVIAEAFGKVSSYRSNLANWESADPRTRGAGPGFPKAGFVYPAMYRDNCYVRVDNYTAQIKAFVRNTWDWITVCLRKTDVDYILHHCQNRKECVPTLQKRGKCWYLDFPFQQDCKLHNKEIFNQTIVAVDLGINSCCVCSVMRSDGTVPGRRFLRLPGEYDSLTRKVSHIK